jgi:hypothetical protein
MCSSFRIFCTFIVGLGLSSGAAFANGGGATRTWVSGVGDDANPCSRTAPCLTFQGAINNTADGGEIDAIDPGEYEPLTINQSIAIDGTRGGSGVIIASATGDGIVIDAGANATVTLRRLTIQGYGVGQTGIRVASARAVHLEDCVISGFVGHAIDFSPAAGGKLFLKNVVANNNGGAGVAMTTAGTSPVIGTLDNVTANGNATGIAAGSNSRITLVNTTTSGNTTTGLLADSDGRVAELTVEHSLASKNGVGATASGTGAILRLSNSTLIDNTTGPLAAASSGKLLSYGNNRITGDTSALTSAKEIATLTLTATPNPRAAGTVPELTAELTGGAGTPTGRIFFKYNNVIVAAQEVSDRSVIVMPIALPDDTFTLTASYEGDDAFAPADSAPLEVSTTGTSSSSGGGGGSGCSTAGGLGLSLLGVTLGSLALARRFRRRR